MLTIAALNSMVMFSSCTKDSPSVSDIEMVFVEGGTFTMGATAEHGLDAGDWEKSVHEVTLSDYYIGKYEVTQQLWEYVMTYSGRW